jgi:protein-disulfide isomerase
LCWDAGGSNEPVDYWADNGDIGHAGINPLSAASKYFITARSTTQGSVEAKIVIVEFSDYECPFCARHANGVAREFSDKYVKPGIVRHVFANNPLVMHPHSTLLATAAFCAGEQDAYWEMHDLLFAEMPSVPPSSSTLIDGKGALKETLKSRATNLGLNPALFSECLEGSRAADRLASDMSLAQKFQLSGTPAFAIGLVEGKERLLIKRFVQGAVPLTVFDSVIDDLSEAITKGD